MGAELLTFLVDVTNFAKKNCKRKKTSIKGAILSIEALKTMPAGRVVAHGFQIKMDSKTPSTPNGEEEFL